MVSFTATIYQFKENGDKTGWTYIEIPANLASVLQPGSKKSFRVKGFLDDYAFSGVSLLPHGEGNFLMALNATIRKGIRKRKDATVRVRMETDNQVWEIPGYITDCLDDEPAAKAHLQSLPKSHQRYFIKWVESAKTEPTKTKRLGQMITALAKGQGYPEMVRANRDKLD
ncbi:MAG: DUF1905 domain-containing protein [Williamsia sp.]|nr:DUF1905 domain-containing protein [Williamsia sp.]